MSPNVIVKFVILFFIRAQSLNVKFSRLDAVVSRAYAKYGVLFRLSVPLLAVASAFALFNLYGFAKANYALTLFLLAKKGRHVNSNIIKQRHLDRAVVTFSEPVPVQVDGEELPYADKYEVHVLPKALRVIMP